MMIFASGKRLATLAVLGACLTACSSMGTTVAGDDTETEVPNASMGRAIMEGLGAVSTRKTPIDYSPRAPLVMPPATKTLAPPEDASKVAQMPNWPNDPDVARAKMLREAAARDAGRDRNDTVPSGELTAVRLPDDNSSPVTRGPLVNNNERHVLRPSEIGKISGVSSDGLYDANGKPQRKALVEPPVAYLQPAPGVPVTTDDPNKEQPSFWKRLKLW